MAEKIPIAEACLIRTSDGNSWTVAYPYDRVVGIAYKGYFPVTEFELVSQDCQIVWTRSQPKYLFLDTCTKTGQFIALLWSQVVSIERLKVDNLNESIPST